MKSQKKQKQKEYESELQNSIQNDNKAIYKKDNKVFIVIHGKPNSKQNMITEINNEFIGIAISSPATDNQANKCLVEFMSDVLDIKKSQLELIRGNKSRHKLIRLNVIMDVDQVMDCIHKYK